MKKELWNGYEIRFVEIKGEWWAVAKDVAVALGYKHTPHMIRNLDDRCKGVHKVDTLGGMQELVVISEFGIYDSIFRSNKPEAKEFKYWVFDMIQELRKQSGFEGFQIFRMLDKEHQKEMMGMIKESVEPNGRIPYIKANNIANKAVSLKHGFNKAIKKKDMTPQMLIDRQEILDSVVDLMIQVDRFDLDVSVSKVVYRKFS